MLSDRVTRNLDNNKKLTKYKRKLRYMLYMSHFYVFGVLIGTTAINLSLIHILLNS